MKFLIKNWKIGAYFGSIALAVGIGMFQTTAKEGMTMGMGSRANCTHAVQSNYCPTVGCGEYNTCTTVEDGGADSCNTNAGTRCYNSAPNTGCNVYSYQKDHAGLTYQECNAE
jgi:hypothetical protein